MSEYKTVPAIYLNCLAQGNVKMGGSLSKNFQYFTTAIAEPNTKSGGLWSSGPCMTGQAPALQAGSDNDPVPYYGFEERVR